MQLLTVPSTIATFPPTASAALSTTDVVRNESNLLRGVAYGVAIQSAALAAIAGTWLMVRHL